jgi:hypothetical protein
MKKLPMKIMIVLAVLSSFFLVGEPAGTMASQNEPRSIPSYSGFADVQSTKNYFIVVGDIKWTASSSLFLWEEVGRGISLLSIPESSATKTSFQVPNFVFSTSAR